MRGHTLQESQGVADSVGRGRGELGRAEHGVDGDDLLHQGSHDP